MSYFLVWCSCYPSRTPHKVQVHAISDSMLGVRSDKKVSRSLFLYLYARVEIYILNYSRAYLGKNI
jgi:hypothetical protein